MAEIAPGSILQRMYLKRRLGKLNIPNGLFYEVGAGSGYNSKIFLDNNFCGEAFDLNKKACTNNRLLNQVKIRDGCFKVHNKDFLYKKIESQADIIFSCMVIEHLDQITVDAYFEKSRSLLTETGKIITIVPANMKYWGIEDEIAGHHKRYTFDCFEDIATKHSLKIEHLVGLTYPISNLLLNMSNYIVRRNESWKQELDREVKTVLSGNREVRFKTSFPNFFKVFLNDATMWPFHILQMVLGTSSNSLVIYCELSKS